MSIAYPIVSISITHVLALDTYRVGIGSVWTTGNLLFRAQACGRDLLACMTQWARGVDARGRGYVLYHAEHPRACGLVIQPLDSRYCFEVFPSRRQLTSGMNDPQQAPPTDWRLMTGD
jgi:hypothetical protein